MKKIENSIVAVVQDIVEGKHGPYAVAISDGLKGSITFSLEPPVWKEDVKPQKGTKVVLENIQKKRAGWRSLSVRFYRPSDEM